MLTFDIPLAIYCLPLAIGNSLSPLSRLFASFDEGAV